MYNTIINSTNLIYCIAGITEELSNTAWRFGEISVNHVRVIRQIRSGVINKLYIATHATA